MLVLKGFYINAVEQTLQIQPKNNAKRPFTMDPHRVIRIAVLGAGVGATTFASELARLETEAAAAAAEAAAAAAAAIRPPCFEVTLFDLGRGTGGRASSRGSRDQSGLAVDHGAPCFDAVTAPGLTLCASLVAAGALHELDDAGGALGSLDAVTGAYRRGDADSAGSSEGPGLEEEDPLVLRGARRFRGSPSMAALCESLKARSGAIFRGGTMVAALEPVPPLTEPSPLQAVAGWRLAGSKGEALGTFDWVVVASSTPAHPRWSSVFGGPPPLVAAAEALQRASSAAAASADDGVARVASSVGRGGGDGPGGGGGGGDDDDDGGDDDDDDGAASLSRAVGVVGSLGAVPVSACLLAWAPGSLGAEALLGGLPFSVSLRVTKHAALARVTVGRWRRPGISSGRGDSSGGNSGERSSSGGDSSSGGGEGDGDGAWLVLQSTADFAAGAATVHGSTSAAARLAGISPCRRGWGAASTEC